MSFSGVIPPVVNRAVVAKYDSKRFNKFVRILTVELSKKKCEESALYRVHFLRPDDEEVIEQDGLIIHFAVHQQAHGFT